MKKIAIFASGSGSNAENIVNFFHEGNRIRVEMVVIDRQNIGVIERMERLGVPVYYFPRKTWRENPDQIIELLRQHDIKLIALAGFLSILHDEFIDAWPRRILNIHPSLLPDFGGPGMWGGNVHEAVLAANREKSGATVHYVDKVVDGGEILMQQEVDVLPGDTPDTLEQRVHEAEYLLYPRAIVEALRRVDTPVNPDVAWAQKLKIDYDPEATRPELPQTPQPVQNEAPGQIPPPLPGTPSPAAAPMNAAPMTSAPVVPVQEAMPTSYLIWSILTTILCSTIPGIVAILFSARVSSLFYSGDIEGAKRASRNAEIWIIISFCIGVLSATLYVPLTFLA